MQRNTGDITGINAANQRMYLALFGFCDQRIEQNFTQTLPTMLWMNINRVFHRIFIGGPGAESAIAGKTKQLTLLVFQANDRKVSLIFGGKPGPHALYRSDFIVVKGGRIEDGIIKDFKYSLGMLLFSAGDQVHGIFLA